MRIIKFRALHKRFNKIYEVRELNFVWNIADLISEANPDGMTVRFDLIELMQFTGLLDKLGKEIYEGDIVIIKNKTIGKKLEEWNGEVFFRDACFYINVRHNRPFLGIDYRMGEIAQSSIRVIGNIYENPELVSPPKAGGKRV